MHNSSLLRLPPELTRLGNLRSLELRFNNLSCLHGIGTLQVIPGCGEGVKQSPDDYASVSSALGRHLSGVSV